jgi:hypothetical protein
MGWSKADFLDVLSKAHRAERAWVEERQTEGHAVAHGKKLVLPNHNPQKDHCPTPDAVGLVRLEIKVRGLKFTCPGDFPYATVLVDDINGLTKGSTPFAWVYISKATGAWVWLSVLDRDDQWSEQTVWDSMRGFNVPMLVAPASCLRHADQLRAILCGTADLDLVEGNADMFRVPKVDKCDPSPRGRSRKAPRQGD